MIHSIPGIGTIIRWTGKAVSRWFYPPEKIRERIFVAFCGSIPVLTIAASSQLKGARLLIVNELPMTVRVAYLRAEIFCGSHRLAQYRNSSFDLEIGRKSKAFLDLTADVTAGALRGAEPGNLVLRDAAIGVELLMFGLRAEVPFSTETFPRVVEV